ncbi:MAG: serine acetyltransferase [Verrucomicrobiales bacterium]|nr:serine acetyltransferase [Verrucomicrobiales bacterium]
MTDPGNQPNHKSRDDIAKALLASYEETGGINHIDALNLPSKRAIPAICEELLKLLFPGFLEEEPLTSGEIAMLTSERIAAVSEKLCTEITRALRCKENPAPDCDKTSRSICCQFLSTLPKVRRLVRTDVEAAYDGDPAAKSFEEIILSYPCIEAIAVQRMAHILYALDIPLLPRMMTEWVHDRTGIDIHPGAHIGIRFFIDHGTGVVLGETCEIGDNVKLYQGVTLGARSFPRDKKGRIIKGTKRHPTVEDNVTVYANATILGGETTIGARSTIGASVFLMHSVPPDTTVALAETNYTSKTRPLNKPNS